MTNWQNTHRWTADPDVVEGYLRDASNLCGHADGVFRPRDSGDVSAILRDCNQHNVPVTVTAQRTATTGAPVPFGGVLLSMEMLDTIHSISEVDAGVVLGRYQNHVEDQGLLFPPDPTSRQECSVGGAIACNASGARSFKYGATRPWVEGLEVVFANGEVRQVDRQTPLPKEWPAMDCVLPAVKTAAGYEPTDNMLDVMIGQEGTLGVITKAWLTTIPNPHVLGLLVFFDARLDCVGAVQELKRGAVRYRLGHTTPQKGAVSPRAIEYFDRHSIALMRLRLDDLPDAACGLFIELESQIDAFPSLQPCLDILNRHNVLIDHTILADTMSERERLYQARHAIPAGVNERVVANGMPKIGTDFAVPDNRLLWMLEAYDEVELPSILFGHIGDNHLHLNMFPTDAQTLKRAKETYVELARIALEYGGTVSAEHGIGKIKKELLAEQVGQHSLVQFRRIKSHLDPNWILGRGTLFDKLSKHGGSI